MSELIVFCAVNNIAFNIDLFSYFFFLFIHRLNEVNDAHECHVQCDCEVNGKANSTGWLGNDVNCINECMQKTCHCCHTNQPDCNHRVRVCQHIEEANRQKRQNVLHIVEVSSAKF